MSQKDALYVIVIKPRKYLKEKTAGLNRPKSLNILGIRKRLAPIKCLECQLIFHNFLLLVTFDVVEFNMLKLNDSPLILLHDLKLL